MSKELSFPDDSHKIRTREYKIFEKEEKFFRTEKTLYEKACNFSERILKVKPDEKSGKEIQKAIDMIHLNCTKEGVTALSALSMLFLFLVVFSLVLTNMFFNFGLSLMGGLLIFLVASPFVWYIYRYPIHLKRKYQISVGSELVMLILYVVLYMRERANLEGALEFASKNLTGPISYDMKKLLWDIEVGVYRSASEAFMDYSYKWKTDKDFVESVQTIISGEEQSEDRRKIMLDQAMNIILEGNRNKAKKYNQNLKMPIMLVHALGILLPIMGLVLFPVMAIFLSDVFKPIVLFFGYDIVLPIILFFLITNIMEKRPVTFSKIDISDHPDIPPEGKFRLKKQNIPAYIPSVLIGFFLVVFGFSLMNSMDSALLGSVLIILGLATGLFLYNYLLSFQRVKLREDVMNIENEFSEALFQIGNRLASGSPIEISLEKSLKDMENLRIQDMFTHALKNIKKIGLTFEQAFFDKDYGVILRFPSKMIKSVMKSVVDSTKKGVQTASLSMLTISRYLRNVKETQEEVEEEMNDVLSSLKFQGFFLSPLVSGIIVTMGLIIIRILQQIGEQMGNINPGDAGAALGSGLLGAWGQIPITPSAFQLIVGIYLIETFIILSHFINGIENGEDDTIGRRDLTASIILIGTIVYLISFAVTLMIFGPFATVTVI